MRKKTLRGKAFPVKTTNKNDMETAHHTSQISIHEIPANSTFMFFAWKYFKIILIPNMMEVKTKIKLKTPLTISIDSNNILTYYFFHVILHILVIFKLDKKRHSLNLAL